MKIDDMNNETLRGWKEIAAYLGCHRSTARRWARLDYLPVKRTKGRVQIEKVELNDWIATRSHLLYET